MIDGPEARRAFLLRKIREQTEALQELEQLHKQDAQLLLRRSVQHQLRHVQRLLPSDSLDNIWPLIHSAYHHSLRLLRDGAAQPRRGGHDSVLFQLPVRLGGLGVPKHYMVAPHARPAMEQSSAKLLGEIMLSLYPDHALGSDGAEASLISQAKRVAAEYARLDKGMMDKLSMEQATTAVANGDMIANACLQTFLIDAHTTLSDRQVQVILHSRTLLGASGDICPDCLQPNCHGHDDDCGDRPHRRTVRHDSSKHLFVAALRRVKGVRVNPEPRIEAQSMRRTDWRVHGLAAAGGGGDTDYDFTFVSLINAGPQRAPGRADHMLLASQQGMRVAATKRLNAYLDSKAQHKSQY
ncbi:hypothetical protein CF327_g7460 [Tilletia walkeri]|nr:hypothetical protein CF327_g7460 [Tilletia walkeri]